MISQQAQLVYQFWFADALGDQKMTKERIRVWFTADDSFDAEILRRFGPLLELAADGKLSHWQLEHQSAVALIIVLDQFPRNLFRGNSRAFAYDLIAQNTTRNLLQQNLDAVIHPLEAMFLYMPLEHAESIQLQDESVERFEALMLRVSPKLNDVFAQLAEYARRHREVIRKFGRFPHRNKALGRETTSDEHEYLQLGGERFGME